MDQRKYCRGCGELGILSEFASDRIRRDGLSFCCRTHAHRRPVRARTLGRGRRRVGILVPSRCPTATDGALTARRSGHLISSCATPAGHPAGHRIASRVTTGEERLPRTRSAGPAPPTRSAPLGSPPPPPSPWLRTGSAQSAKRRPPPPPTPRR